MSRPIWKYKEPLPIFKANIEAVYQLATADDIRRGVRWYPDARKQVESLAERFNLEPWRVAGVVAALSPSITWSRNLETAESFIAAHVAGVDVLDRSFKAGTYGYRNKRVALDFLEVDAEQWAGSGTMPKLGPKTGAFYSNILGSDDATIDGHMYAVMIGDETASTQDIYAQHGRITAKRHRLLATALSSVAADNGLPVATFQAIVWITWRRLKNENPNLRQGYRVDEEVPF